MSDHSTKSAKERIAGISMSWETMKEYAGHLRRAMWPRSLDPDPDEFAAEVYPELIDEIESLREERDVLRECHTRCVELLKSELTDNGEPPLIDGRELGVILGVFKYAE